MLKLVDVNDGMGQALLTLADAETATQGNMRDAADAAIEASWVPSLTAAAASPQQRKLLATGARADVTNLGFTLVAAVGPALSGGLDASHWYAVDYGMTPKQITAPNRRKTIRIAGSGREMKVTTLIWVGRNLPARNSAGRVVWPTIGEQSQAYVAAWLDGMLAPFEAPFDVDDTDTKAQVSGSWR